MLDLACVCMSTGLITGSQLCWQRHKTIKHLTTNAFYIEFPIADFCDGERSDRLATGLLCE